MTGIAKLTASNSDSGMNPMTFIVIIFFLVLFVMEIIVVEVLIAQGY
jgi:hypothetical protein